MKIKKYLGTVTILFLLVITLSGCKQGPKVIQLNNKIEAASSYNLKEFIQVKDEGSYKINVVSDNINRYELGEYKVVYEIVDEESNTFTYDFTFEVVDTTPPTISSKEIVLYVGEEFNIYDLFKEGYWYKVIDKYDGRITSKDQIKVDKEIDTSHENDGIIKVTAIDSSGNKKEREINYRVKKITYLEYIERNITDKELNILRSSGNGELEFVDPEPDEWKGSITFNFTNFLVVAVSDNHKNTGYIFDENFTITSAYIFEHGKLEYKSLDDKDVINRGNELIQLMKDLENELTDGKFSILGLKYSDIELTVVE